MTQRTFWIRRFNEELDHGVSRDLATEKWLARRCSALAQTGGVRQALYWLSLARVAELAIYCAGVNADAGHLGEVGDLMFNPRLIMVHVRGQAAPVRKQRHTGLIEQFGQVAGTPHVVGWLRDNTINEIREKPIVPALLEALEAGGRLRHDYVKGLREKSHRIGKTLGLVSCCLNAPVRDMAEYMSRLSGADRRMVAAGLCRFDLSIFYQLGREIESACADPGYQSPFLEEAGPPPCGMDRPGDTRRFLHAG